MGQVIYKPKGKAGEYAAWACNLYVGCSNDCEYCYCKRGVLGSVMGGTEPRLKAGLGDEAHALDVFMKECNAHIDELRKDGLFFTFSSDPMLKETKKLNWECVKYAAFRGIKCDILTKRADFLDDGTLDIRGTEGTVRWGFTLTGADALEKNASPTSERIRTMQVLHSRGFKTFASIEPVINPARAVEILESTKWSCDQYKVGLMSGVKGNFYWRNEVQSMYDAFRRSGKDVYFKNSLTEYINQ